MFILLCCFKNVQNYEFSLIWQNKSFPFASMLSFFMNDYAQSQQVSVRESMFFFGTSALSVGRACIIFKFPLPPPINPLTSAEGAAKTLRIMVGAAKVPKGRKKTMVSTIGRLVLTIGRLVLTIVFLRPFGLLSPRCV